jgi:hypothetical protein
MLEEETRHKKAFVSDKQQIPNVVVEIKRSCTAFTQTKREKGEDCFQG